MKYAAFAIVSILSAICVLGVGCSRDDSADPEVAKPSSPDETTEDTVTAPEPSLLDPSQWSMVKWNSREIHESVAESEASLETDAKGLLAKTHKKFQRVQVLLQMELFDDFEVHLHGISPSSDELQAAGVSDPTRQSPLIGFRSANGHPMFRTHIKARWDRRDEFEATVRRCRGTLSIWIDGERTVHLPNNNISSGYVFLELGSPTHLHITDCEVLEGVEPDPAKDKTPVSAPSSSMAGLPPMMVPPMGFPGPMAPGAGFPFSAHAPPQPSRGEPLKSDGDWYVPKLGNTQLNSVIAQDVRFADDDRGLKISKTNASGTLWVVRKMSTEDDFEATAYVTLPSMQTVMASGDRQSMIGFGAYPVQADANGVSIPSPPPMPTTTRDVSVTFRRVKGRVEMEIDGVRTGSQAVRIDGPVILGFLMQGSIHFWIRDFRMSAKDTTKDDILPTRTWTESSGERTVTATFLRLDGETVHFRKNDGSEVAIPIGSLSEADQQTARELARRQTPAESAGSDR
ncbi:MAG: hypothetical protein H8E44_14865 [Planctomycetes bacterium]|nr:hypothetical protein [Planctomycetota bacterium]MBL7040960.1 hypothetical protein [Pirellulaceae bacterium]